MMHRRLMYLLVAVLAAAAANVDAEDSIVVGFQQTFYSVTEGEETSICVEIISPPDIGSVAVSLQVLVKDAGVPGDTTKTATPDNFDGLFGEGADYPQPKPNATGQIYSRPLTQASRSVCYNQRTHQDNEPEGDEYFTLRVATETRTQSNVTIDADFASTLVTIVDDGNAFLALPCARLPVEQYEYFGLSYYGAPTNRLNHFVIVGCEDETEVQVGSDTVVKLNTMETYLWESSKVAGTRIISRKPIAVFVGTQCTHVPSSRPFCDHQAEQIPPTALWGTRFISSPLAGRSSGDLYRVLAARASTTVTINCNNFDSVLIYTLDLPGSWEEFTTPDMSYCSITSDKPLLVMQFGLGYDFDDIGDPFMMMITPVEQYSNNYLFNIRPEYSTNYITVYVSPEDFKPQNIFFDDSNLENSTWRSVYCSNGEICGHITFANVTPGDHWLYHNSTLSHVGMSVYGFSYHNGYGYPGGLKADSIDIVGPECKEGDVRLVGGESMTEGRVEVCVLGTWGTVCDDLWDDEDARIICRQLGLVEKFAVGLGNARYGSGKGPIYLDNLLCTGEEESLLDCLHNGIGNHDCKHSEDASVYCYKDDGCENGKIRLADGTATEGRVEVCLNGVWGTVCNNHWNIINARVVCRQLRLPFENPMVLPGYNYNKKDLFGLLDDVSCDGTEVSLTDCPSRRVGVYHCTSGEIVSVACYNDCPELEVVHGSIFLSGRTPNSIAVYCCDNGFELVGEPVRLCLSDSSWSGKTPVCLPVCPKLFAPKHGTVFVTGNYSIGSIASYSCDTGYGLTGESTLTCGADGSWNNKPPICSRTCPKLDNPINGRVEVTTTLPQNLAIFTCDPGVGLVGKSVLTCENNGSWSGTPPVCKLYESYPIAESPTPTSKMCTPPAVPGNVENVHRLGCGMLKWDAPDECGELTYKIRFFSGQSYDGTTNSQKIVLSSHTTSLNFTAQDVPNGRPLYCIVKARNRNGEHSPSWSSSIVAAVAGCP